MNTVVIECEHLRTDIGDVMVGLSNGFDPQSVSRTICIDCGEILEAEDE